MNSADQIAVKVENISLCFNLGLKKRPKNVLKRILSSISRVGGNVQKFWALRDINLTIYKGEIFGIIGRNGAGKTTLGRIIGGIYVPTTGRVLVDGTVTALFSLGGGFQQNLELTGRENVYNYCLYQNYSKSRTREIIDRIVDFSELGHFIDAPVRTYSSGMKGRLIFSAALFLEPDILILDEVLSAGDQAFTRKAGTILDAFKSRETTIIFITHAVEMARNHCQRILWLDNGEVKKLDLPGRVIPEFQEYMDSVKGAVRKEI